MKTLKKLFFFGEKRKTGKYELILRMIVFLMIYFSIHTLVSSSDIKYFIILMFVIILGSANMVLVPFVENEEFFQVEDRKKRFIVSSVLQLAVICIVTLFAFVMISRHVYYQDYSVLKNDVDEHLTNKYDTEFIITDDITKRGSSYTVRCYPKENTELKFITFWKKGKPEKSSDTYLNYKWRYQAEPEVETYIESLYGKETLMHFEFWTTNDGLLNISDEVKYMDYNEIKEKYKDEVFLYISTYTFTSELDKEKESERAYDMINNYLQKNAGDWVFEIFFFSEDHKDELMKEYEKDNGFF